MMSLGVDLFRFSIDFLSQKEAQHRISTVAKPSKNREKMVLKSHWFLTCIFCSIFIDFYWILKGFKAPQTKDFDATRENAHLGENLQKPAKNLGFYSVLRNIC